MRRFEIRLFVVGLLAGVGSCWVGESQAQFAASNMTLTAHVDLETLGGANGNDIWGWTDSLTGREYALMGRSDGTSFVDVTDPYNVEFLGVLPSRTGSSTTWRDIKTYNNHAYIVADGSVGPHGLQIFDLTNLRGVTSPQTFATTAFDTTFRNAHNLAINEESGHAYVVASNVTGNALIYDLSNPVNPTVVGNSSRL